MDYALWSTMCYVMSRLSQYAMQCAVKCLGLSHYVFIGGYNSLRNLLYIQEKQIYRLSERNYNENSQRVREV